MRFDGFARNAQLRADLRVGRAARHQFANLPLARAVKAGNAGAPPAYAPLLPQQVFSGTFGGSILVALGYALLAAFIKDRHTRFVVFFMLGALLLLLSFNLPYRLRYTQSPRFSDVTFAAQIAQGMLHTLVVGIGVMCFVTDKSMWE